MTAFCDAFIVNDWNHMVVWLWLSLCRNNWWVQSLCLMLFLCMWSVLKIFSSNQWRCVIYSPPPVMLIFVCRRCITECKSKTSYAGAVEAQVHYMESALKWHPALKFCSCAVKWQTIVVQHIIVHLDPYQLFLSASLPLQSSVKSWNHKALCGSEVPARSFSPVLLRACRFGGNQW